MRIAVRVAAVAGGILSFVVFSAPVFASLIYDAGLAFDGWAGTTYFDFDNQNYPADFPVTPGGQIGDNLEGYVEWVIYDVGNFPLGYTGYTPTADQLVYAYQIFVTGNMDNPVTNVAVAIIPGRPKNNIGFFSGGSVSGDVPTDQEFLTQYADWDFDGIATGTSSRGIAFSSPNVPENLFGSVVDGGQSAPVIFLPSPSATAIPEPSMLVMLMFGAGSLILARRRR